MGNCKECGAESNLYVYIETNILSERRGVDVLVFCSTFCCASYMFKISEESEQGQLILDHLSRT